MKATVPTIVNLEDLVGAHALTGVDMVTDQGDDANGIRFRLGTKTYLVRENEDDGWRSSMRDIIVTDAPLVNAFKPVKVVAAMSSDGDNHHGVCDILQFKDAKTGAVVLEVGTGNTDDYYPYYVGSFTPENMSVNAKVKR